MVIVIYHQYGSLFLQAQVELETVSDFGLILGWENTQKVHIFLILIESELWLTTTAYERHAVDAIKK